MKKRNLMFLILFLTVSVYATTTKIFYEAVKSTVSVQGGNIQIFGNSLISTDTNGDVNINPNGSGGVAFVDLTATTVPYLDAGKELVSSAVTPTELGFLTGIGGTGIVPVSKGGSGQSSYTDGQLLIGNTSGNTLAKSTLTAGSNVTITNGGGTITIAASSSATPAYTYVSQSSTLNPAVIGDYYSLSGASFNITLPTAASIAGQGFIFEHGGTNLTQVYTFLTTSSQTIGGVASGSYALYTTGETLHLISDGANWRIYVHKASNDPVSFTPTGTWDTNVTYTGLWRRQGRYAIIEYKIAVGGQPGVASADGDLIFNLPTNMPVMDTTFILDTTNQQLDGQVDCYDATIDANTADEKGLTMGRPEYTTSSTITPTMLQYSAASQHGHLTVDRADPFTWAINDKVFMTVRVPITGWQP